MDIHTRRQPHCNAHLCHFFTDCLAELPCDFSVPALRDQCADRECCTILIVCLAVIFILLCDTDAGRTISQNDIRDRFRLIIVACRLACCSLYGVRLCPDDRSCCCSPAYTFYDIRHFFRRQACQELFHGYRSLIYIKECRIVHCLLYILDRLFIWFDQLSRCCIISARCLCISRKRFLIYRFVITVLIDIGYDTLIIIFGCIIRISNIRCRDLKSRRRRDLIFFSLISIRSYAFI